MSASDAVADIALDAVRGVYVAPDRATALDMFTFDLRMYDMGAKWEIEEVDTEICSASLVDDAGEPIGQPQVRFRVEFSARMVDEGVEE